jgi:hypothetical protein
MVLAHIAGVPVEEALFATPGLLAGAGAFAMNWRARRSGNGTEGAAVEEPRPVEPLGPFARASLTPLNDRPAPLQARSETRRP